ncbi:TetR/AcrR family transcriptional regulator [Streptomyces chartreusis]|uniref:TetR/AcrR family transcriptional regulator n=1 Tax=Streptomyces chartreusis TaxID=1969 RepID=UPI00362F1C98
MQNVEEKSPSRGGLRERKKQATRAALVEAAVRLAAEHGAENVTVEAISDAAGVSPRTFFNYFDARDDVFVMIGAESSARVRRAVLDAPRELSPLEALRDAMAAELSEVEQQHQLWTLHASVLRESPRLLVRALSIHTDDESALAAALADRIAAKSPSCSSERPAHPAPEQESPRQSAGLYPHLLAAVGLTAVRVAFEHWCVGKDSTPFPDVFQETFQHLAAGLAAPAGDRAGR